MSKKICVLEDNAEILEIVGIILEGEGHKVHGFERVNDFNSGHPGITADLFLLDIMLPDGNGLDVCLQLKADPRTAAVPVIMMTASSKADRDRALAISDGLITKPFDINDLAERINSALGV